MNKTEALEWAGGVVRLSEKLSEAGFQISPQAISKWPDGPIPPLRAYQIRELQAGELVPDNKG